MERFAAAVASNPVFQALYTDRIYSIGLNEAPELELMLEAARSGITACLPESFCREYVNQTDQNGATALHVAVECGNVEDVKFLLSVGARVKADGHGYGVTPLHLAASSTEPNPEIAKLLIDEANKTNDHIRNATIPETNDDESTRGYTALHFAADNEYISHEFIQTLESIDPAIKNSNGKTAFHVAAGAENPDIIVSMLQVFTPVKTGWKMTSIDTKKGPTLLEICTKAGNAKAVELLIKYGAHMSEQILFRLIKESADNPTKTDKLIAVYRTITENCVLWKWLTHTSDLNHYPRRGTEPQAYTTAKRNIMLGLLTKPQRLYNNRNVLEYAIMKGDKVFLNEIVNTPDVFKIEDKIHEVKYDITHFVTSSDCGEPIQRIRGKRTATVQSAGVGLRSPPRWPYLYLITENTHLWENTDILQLEPFLAMTQPMCSFVQITYFVMAFFQLANMIGFSMLYMPPYCPFQYQLPIECNSTNSSQSLAVPPEPFVVNVPPYSQPHYFFLLAIIPTAISIGAYHTRYPRARRRELAYLSARFLLVPILYIWCATTFLFRKLYLSLTSLTYFIGWLATLSFFTDASENATFYSFLLKEIIIKDMSFQFGIVFLSVLLSFSSAIHVLRQDALLGKKDYFDTLYNVFASALTTGDFMEETFRDDDVFRIRLLQTTFAMYLCCVAIILVNILITILSYRYDRAIKKVKNLWRFYTVRSWLQVSVFCFTEKIVMKIFHCYWKYGKYVHTAYDAVSIDQEDDKLFLHIYYSK